MFSLQVTILKSKCRDAVRKPFIRNREAAAYLSNGGAEFALKYPLQRLQLGRGKLAAPLQPVQQLNYPAYICEDERGEDKIRQRKSRQRLNGNYTFSKDRE